MATKQTNNCMNCINARKRSHFDLKRYGSYGFPFECLKEKQTTYKKPTDTCDKWEKK